jgi:hypothetical protein
VVLVELAALAVLVELAAPVVLVESEDPAVLVELVDLVVPVVLEDLESPEGQENPEEADPRLSNGNTTLSTGKGFPIATMLHATSIPRQTVPASIVGRTTGGMISPGQVHLIGMLQAGNQTRRRIRGCPIEPVQVPQAVTTPSAGWIAGGRRTGKVREATRACHLPSHAAEGPPGLPGVGVCRAGEAAEEAEAGEAADRIQEKKIPTSRD